MASIPRWARKILVASVSVFLLALVGGNSYGAWYLAHRTVSPEWDAEETADPVLERDLAALAPEDVRIGPENLRGWYAEGPSDRPGWVLVHGGGANRTSEVSRARALHEEGHSVVSLELSYTSGAQPFGGGSRESREIASALEWLAERTGGRRPLLYGCSLGAFCVLVAVAAGAPAAAVVADSGFVSVLRARADQYPVALFSAMPLLYPLFSGGAELRDLSRSVEGGGLPIPTLIIHGTADDQIDAGNGPDLARITGGELWAPDGVGHCEAFRARRGEFLERLGSLAARASDRSPSVGPAIRVPQMEQFVPPFRVVARGDLAP